MDVHLRLLRYFAAVAGHGNLTRAAEALYVSQPALTKQIKQLERHLGVELFTRSRTGMALTEAGRELLRGTPALLADWDQVWQQTRSTAARAARTLRVGFVASAANEATTAITAAFTRRRPGWRIDMRQTGWTDPSAGLSDGEVDAAVVRLPFPGHQRLRVTVLFDEPRWVALPQKHPLATRDDLTMTDLHREAFVVAPAETGRWQGYWTGDDTGTRGSVVGAVARNTEEWLTAIANGYGISLAPASAARFYPRPGVTYRPVHGISPSRVAVAWTPAADNDPAVRDFVACCVESCRPD